MVLMSDANGGGRAAETSTVYLKVNPIAKVNLIR